MSAVQTQTLPAGTQNGIKHADSVENVDQLFQALQSMDVSPLWMQMKRLNPPAPNPTTVPFIWHYAKLRPYLERAGHLVTEKQAERRVLMLVNPAREAPFTTDTLYAGLQLVQPGEVAPAHRHTAFAVRFIIEGHGGFTAVHGKRMMMRPRDVIVTPTWNFHDHGKKGASAGGGDDGPVIWLDGLDLPNFMHFPVHFVEHFSRERYPATDVDDSPIAFPWEKMQATLDAAQGPWASAPYLMADGREIGRVIGASAERVNAEESSPAIRETASSVYHIIQGSGYTEIEGEKFSWKQGDTFCIPAWNKYQHFADPKERVYLYRFDDKPMLNALGFYRLEGVDTEKYVSN